MIKPVTDYPNYYVSDDGKVYSTKRGHMKELKSWKHRDGYKVIELRHNGKRICFVHRLVAKAFLDNPNNYPCINHKDEDKQNNRVSNLEWCDHSYNNNYGTKIERCNRKLIDPTKPFPRNTSGRKGVARTRVGTWRAYIGHRHLGSFKTFEEAVRARERAEQEIK